MNCIIIEDELPAQKILLHYLDKLPDILVLGTYQSALAANKMINSQQVDLVFLDINLPDISGMDYIKTIDNPPAVIITTAYPDYALDSFELPTIIDYLVKPFSFDRFLKAINKAEKNKNNGASATIVQAESNTEATIFLNIDKTIHQIRVNDIKYILSEKNYVTVVTTTKRFSYLESLKNLETKLPKELFIRTHKSYIINRNYINKITGNMVSIAEEKIPIGRTYKNELFKKLDL